MFNAHPASHTKAFLASAIVASLVCPPDLGGQIKRTEILSEIDALDATDRVVFLNMLALVLGQAIAPELDNLDTVMAEVAARRLHRRIERRKRFATIFAWSVTGLAIIVGGYLLAQVL